MAMLGDQYAQSLTINTNPINQDFIFIVAPLCPADKSNCPFLKLQLII